MTEFELMLRIFAIGQAAAHIDQAIDQADEHDQLARIQRPASERLCDLLDGCVLFTRAHCKS